MVGQLYCNKCSQLIKGYFSREKKSTQGKSWCLVGILGGHLLTSKGIGRCAEYEEKLLHAQR